MTRALVLALCAACYHPASEQPCTIACDYPDGTCPSGLACSPTGLCTLASGGCAVADAPLRDAPLPDVPNNCFRGQPRGFFSATAWCPTPGDSFALIGPYSTDSAATCLTVPGLEQYCTVIGDVVTIAAGTQASFHGSRPLLLVANTLVIQGTLDVSSRRAEEATNGPGAGASAAVCGVGEGSKQLYGGTGGAGGSFGFLGGYGGSVGGIVGGKPAQTSLVPTTLRGGCPGGTGGVYKTGSIGAGGAGGGAVYLLARYAIDMSSTGQILAVGEGGGGTGIGGSGGGGGGSGGMIVFDAPNLAEAMALVLADGGGGGGGASLTAGGSNGSEAITLAPATGGDGAAPSDHGGDGSSRTTGVDGGSGSPGSAAVLGGGGGGGGGGFILLYVPNPPDTSHFSPQPS